MRNRNFPSDVLSSYLVFVDNPALILIVPAFMAFLILDNLIYRNVSQPRPLGKDLAVSGLAHPGCTGNNDVWS